MTFLDPLHFDDSTAGWMDRAACKASSPQVFFPERGESPVPAKEVCSGCPVTGECLAYALHYRIRFGIWGGTSVRDRRKMRRVPVRRTPLRPVPLHGTQLRYRNGCRCDGCREASAQYALLHKRKAG